MGDVSPVTPRILTTDPVWATAFRAYWATTAQVADVERMVSKGQVLHLAWRAFLASSYCPQSGTDGAVPLPGKKLTEHCHHGTCINVNLCHTCRQCVTHCAGTCDTPVTPVTPTIIKTPAVAPVAPQPSTLATSAVAVAPAAVQSNGHTSAVETSALNPFTDLITTELRKIGWAPERAITAEQAQSIAENAAFDVVNMVVEELEKQGKLTAYAGKQVIEVSSKGIVTKTIVGKKAPSWFADLVELAQCRIPVLLVGPAGCGKTTAAALLADVLGLSFTRVSLSAGVDEGIVQGWLLPVGNGGKFEYVPSALVHAYEHGGVVLLDELDSADANMLVILSAVLDNGIWEIPSRYECPQLVRHPNFIVIGAANTFGHGANRQFSAAQQLDERTLSRFRQGQIACDYDADLEQTEFDAAVVEFGQRLRARCRAIPAFGKDVSTRDIESNTVKVRTNGMNVGKAWYRHFIDWNTDEVQRVHARLDHNARTVTLD